MTVNAECDQKGTENSPQLGKPATEELIKAWDQSIFPDGQGLPVGKGSVEEGEDLYKIQCAICHGPGAVGGTAEELAGGEQGLTGEYPDKIVGVYWPYATTLYDFIKRSMPLNAPGSLSDDQTYALTAYLLHLNNIVDEDVILSNETLPEVEMPNRDGFIWIYSDQKKYR
ncbi:MAG: c-type cytochrome [Gammaproteobacteria bacterium]